MCVCVKGGVHCVCARVCVCVCVCVCHRVRNCLRHGMEMCCFKEKGGAVWRCVGGRRAAWMCVERRA
jgi:hypothetical protein